MNNPPNSIVLNNTNDNVQNIDNVILYNKLVSIENQIIQLHKMINALPVYQSYYQVPVSHQPMIPTSPPPFLRPPVPTNPNPFYNPHQSYFV